MSAGYLLDTSVISMLAPGREAHLTPAVSNWLLTQSNRLFIPSIAIAELTQGIGKLRRTGATERANGLNQWLERLLAGYGDRILPLDALTAVTAGELSDAAMAIGRHPGFSDVAIAAIAKHANLVILTRNLKHFEPLGVACTDPFEQLPTREWAEANAASIDQYNARATEREPYSQRVRRWREHGADDIKGQ